MAKRKRGLRSWTWKRWLLVGTTIFAIGGTGVYATMQTIDLQQEERENTAEKLLAEAKTYYFDSSETFLKSNINDQQIKQLEEKSEGINSRNKNKQRVEITVRDILERYAAQKGVNELFDSEAMKSPALDGKTSAEFPAIKEDVTEKVVDETLSKNNKINSEKSDPFYKALADLTKTAKDQASFLDTYKKDIKALEESDRLSYSQIELVMKNYADKIAVMDNKIFVSKVFDMMAIDYQRLNQKVSTTAGNSSSSEKAQAEASAKEVKREASSTAASASQAASKNSTAVRPTRPTRPSSSSSSRPSSSSSSSRVSSSSSSKPSETGSSSSTAPSSSVNPPASSSAVSSQPSTNSTVSSAPESTVTTTENSASSAE